MVQPSHKSHTSQREQRPIAEHTVHLAAALAGDAGAFEHLTEPYRRELMAHCYRILGSTQDAEDLVQETLLRAWRRLKTYEGRASLRSWLYKIATNACLDALAHRPRRSLPPTLYPKAESGKTNLKPVTEPIWLEPFPDELLAPDDTFSAPEARYERMESISLSFLAALQLLPPRQRCVLILCDVLDWHAEELAELLGTSLASVNSLLQRARTTMRKNYTAWPRGAARTGPIDQATRTLLDRYLRAWESGDVGEIVALLRKDAVFSMPPLPLWVQGRAAIRNFIASSILDGEAKGRWRLVSIRSNGSPGFAWYQRDEASSKYRAFAIQVLEVGAGRVSTITTFVEPGHFRFFDLPAELES